MPMGANIVNTMCERLGRAVAPLVGGELRLQILTNLADLRVARARLYDSRASVGDAILFWT